MTEAGERIQGPSALRRPRVARVPRGERIVSGIAAAGLLAVLAVASALDAAPEGIGTHTQLGLDECSFVTMFGYPCATCGMTTAFTHAADFSLLQSVMAQPAGAVFALAAAISVWILGYIAVTGSLVGRTLMGAAGMRLVWSGLILLGAAWAYKVVVWDSGVSSGPGPLLSSGAAGL